MKALACPSMYPGIFGSRFLLCLLFCLPLFGNTYQQDAEGSQKKISGFSPSTRNHGDTEPSTKSLEKKNLNNLKLPLSLDENNIMQSEISSNDGDHISESEEYDEELQPVSSESESALVSEKSKDIATSLEDDDTSYVGNFTNDSKEVDDKNYMDQYSDYDRDYENDTGFDYHGDDVSSDYLSDKIQMHSASPQPNYSESTESTYQESPTDVYSDETLDPDESTSMEGSNKHYTRIADDSSRLPDKSILIEEAVVSVVTTKSVVNGTISVPTPAPQTTEQISSPPSSDQHTDKEIERHQTTENSIVLASVQTSRSISGARFLPFPVVEQVVQVAQNVNTNMKTPNTSESTESIIDKLDRVQSELSNGFLSSGFRNSGNTLQLDVLSGTDQARKSKTTTMRTPVISKFVPHRYNANRKITTAPKPTSTLSTLKPIRTALDRTSTSTTTVKSITTKNKPHLPVTNKRLGESAARAKSVVVQDVSAFLPPGYNSAKVKDESTGKSVLEDILSKAKVDISLLPPGYNNKQADDSDRQKNKQSSAGVIVKKSQVDISSFLPPGYNRKPESISASNTTSKQPTSDEIMKKTQVDLASLLPPGYKNPSSKDASDDTSKDSLLDDILKKAKTVDLSSLLPAGYNEKKKTNTSDEDTNEGSIVQTLSNVTAVESGTTQATVSTTKSGGLKIVFPSRPGGRKPINRVTTTSPLRGEAPAAFKPHIQKGWPVRATTEFTGWPSSSTTPISIEKLLEAARTATAVTGNTSSTSAPSITSSTTTTTTTTTTHRPTTPGICEEECELAGTIRLVGNTTWVPELLDRNTIEWQQLANRVENEIDVAFAKSSSLRKWYKKVKIDSFSQGSILVDYFVELNEVGRKINTQELKAMFHDSLNIYNSKDNNSELESQLVLGAFTIDPASTDFVVVPKFALPPQIDYENTLIPQWAIAVIVIGVGGLLFIIVFGVFVLTNRQNAAKIKPSMPMYDEEIEKNIIHKNGPPPINRSNDYPKEDLYNTDAVWNDKSFDSRSNKTMVDGPYQDSSRYNLYDSWKSEWNGYYYNASHASSRSPGYDSTTNMSRQHYPDYDTNF